jgi:thiol-disulfide isomerase/thioredoxin
MENFAETVATNDIVLVDFWAEWCAPCRMFGPTFEKSSEKYPNIVHGKVNTEQEQELAARAGSGALGEASC